MTLERAVAILNERRHSGVGNWRYSRKHEDDDLVYAEGPPFRHMTHSTAIALAEWYEREAHPSP